MQWTWAGQDPGNRQQIGGVKAISGLQNPELGSYDAQNNSNGYVSAQCDSALSTLVISVRTSHAPEVTALASDRALGILDLQVPQDVHRAETDQRSGVAQRAVADTQQEGQ